MQQSIMAALAEERRTYAPRPRRTPSSRASQPARPTSHVSTRALVAGEDRGPAARLHEER